MMKSELDLDPWGDGEERLAEQSVPAVQPITAATDELLPENIRDATAELARLDKLQPANREDAAIVRTRREKICKRIIELQHGTPAPIITSEHINQRKEAEENRHIDRQQRLDKLAKAYPAVRTLIKTATKTP